jgi:hypothetical protein
MYIYAVSRKVVTLLNYWRKLIVVDILNLIQIQDLPTVMIRVTESLYLVYSWYVFVKSSIICTARAGQLRSQDARTLKGQGLNSWGVIVYCRWIQKHASWRHITACCIRMYGKSRHWHHRGWPRGTFKLWFFKSDWTFSHNSLRGNFCWSPYSTFNLQELYSSLIFNKSSALVHLVTWLGLTYKLCIRNLLSTTIIPSHSGILTCGTGQSPGIQQYESTVESRLSDLNGT